MSRCGPSRSRSFRPRSCRGQIAGTRGSSLILNLPGKPSAIHDCLLAVFPAIPYCIDLIGGPYLVTEESYVTCFRPKNARQPERELAVTE